MFSLAVGTIVSPTMYEYVWGESETATTPVVADLILKENDVRHRSNESFVWKSGRNNQKLHVGDALFTGSDSVSKIKFLSGNETEISENSLIVFNSVDGISVPDLNFGNFKIKVKKDFKLSINGQVTKIKAENAELELDLKDGEKPKVKVITGSAQIAKANPKRPEEEVFVDIESIEQLDLPLTYNPMIDEGLTVEDKFVEPSKSNQTSYAYTYRVCDMYTCDQKAFTKKRSPDEVLPKEVNIEWQANGADRIYIERANNLGFENSIKTDVPGFLTNYRTTNSYLGDNYYRLSSDNVRWSDAVSYNVKAQTLDFFPPDIKVEKNKIYIKEDNGLLNYTLVGQEEFSEYIIEVYSFTNYQRKLIYVQRSSTLTNQLKFTKAGNYSLRARGVNFKEEVTSLGKEMRFGIDSAKPAVPIRLAEKKKQPVKKIAKKLPEKKQIERKPSAVENVIKKKWRRTGDSYNDSYVMSRLSLEGAGFTMFSTDQVSNQTSEPVALLLGLRLQHWFGNYGLGGTFRSKTFDISDSETVTPLQIEARFSRRWLINWGILGRKITQTSLIGALESYSNVSTTDEFAPRYSLAKVGIGLDIPVYKRWDTGGEVFLGLGFDGSKKYEISGYLDYYFNEELSFGGGYRVHLFEAGSEKSAPAELPYREGYGEAFTSLRWHY